MPELPEVETIRLDLKQAVTGKKITDVEVRRDRVVKYPDLKKFRIRLKSAVCRDVIRRGKLLVMELETAKKKPLYLAVHLRMSGQLVYGAKTDNFRVAFKLSNGCYLSYNDQRLLGELRLVDNWHDLPIVRNMGPEPLDKKFKFSDFRERLRAKKTKIKPLLLDQTFIAGIGNIYAAEALFLSGIDPSRPADKLKEREAEKLFRSIQKILKSAIRHRGTSFDKYRDGRGQKGSYVKKLYVYGRHKEKCFCCNGEIKRIVLGGRGTFFCPNCQN